MKNRIVTVLLFCGLSLLSAIEIWLPPSNIAYPFVKTCEMNEKLDYRLYRDVNTELLPVLIKQKSGLYLLPANVALKLYNSGVNINVIAGFSTDMLKILSNDEGVVSIKDLDKREFIAGGQGSSPDIISKHLFNSYEIAPNYQYGSSPEIARFFVAGKYKNVILPQPLAEFAVYKSKTEIKQFNVTDEWKRIHTDSDGIPQLVLVSINTDGLVNTDEVLESFSKFETLMIEDKKSSANDIKELLGYKFPEEVIMRSIAPINVLKGDKAKKELNDYYKAIMALEPKSIGSKLPDEEFYN